MGSASASSERVALASVAEVLPGHAPRAAAPDDARSDWHLLLGRNALPHGGIDWQNLDTCVPIRGIERFLAHAGDVLLTTRTTNVRAVTVEAPLPNVVVSAQFALIRPDASRLNPAYLTWYLTRASTRECLRAVSRGTTIPFLALPDLRELQIELPSIDRQRQIARVAELVRHESDLHARLRKAREKLLESALSTEPASQPTP